MSRPARCFLLAVSTAAILAWNGSVRAEPLRLKADAYARTKAPVGLLVLQGEDRTKPWIDAEALAWMGARPELTGDVLTLTVRVRDPEGRGEVRAGRFLASMGAIRPLHLDGARALGRLPTGTTAEVFGGVPVVPRFDYATFDMAAGGRLGQAFGDRAALGMSYLQRRSAGDVADEEAGPDLAIAPTDWLDLAARTAFDLNNRGLTDGLVSASVRSDELRVEVFGTHRSPTRMLPATSLFSVLGNVPSTRVGSTVKWMAAPRLDLLATGAGQLLYGEIGSMWTFRSTLRTDDDGLGSVGVELRRQQIPGAEWSGARIVGVAPLWREMLRASTELELVRPDDPRGRGDYWPWALVAMTWRGPGSWDIAMAAEAASTPTAARELNMLVRASYGWEKP